MTKNYNQRKQPSVSSLLYRWLFAFSIMLSCLFAGTAYSQSCTGVPSAAGVASASLSSVCPNSTVALTVLGASTDAGIQYQWYEASTTGGPYTAVALANDTVYNTGSMAFTTYYVMSVKCSATGDSVLTNEVSVTVLPALPASISLSASSTNVCAGTSVTITATPTNGGTPTYVFYVNGNQVQSGASDSYTYTPSNGDVVTAQMTSTATCVTGSPASSNSISITVNNSTASISGATSFCAGGSTTLTASSGVSYLWSDNSTGASITVNAAGTYTVTITDANGCTSVASANVIENSNPAAPIVSVSGATTFCNGGSVVLTSDYSSGNTWSNGATTSSITATSSGNYSVTYTDGNGCSATSSATSVTANNASVSISGVSSFCIGGSTTLTATANPAATDYAWTLNGSPLATTSSITANTAGVYAVTTTDANGCTATASQSVSESDFPTISISSNCSTILNGNSATLTATAATNFGTIANYQWVLNGSTNVGSNSSTYNASTGGSYTCVVTNSIGCTTTSNAVAVENTSALSGAYTIGGSGCNNFTSFANAFAALNTRGVSGSVTVTVAAGYTETAPSGGLSLNMCSLSSSLLPNASKTITFVNGGTPKPVISAGVGASTTVDAIVKLVGVDYVTFNGINVAESASNTTATTRAEWGYALLKCDGNNGANNNTIINCSITLNKANTASRGIYSGNHTDANTTALTYSGLVNDPASVDASRNGRNTFYGNAIQNAYFAISLNGNSASSGNISCNDTLNAIGVIGQAANVITNFGGGAVACVAVGGSNQRNITIDNNTITGGTGTTAAMSAINPGGGVWGKIRNNTISLTGSGTTVTIRGIDLSFSGGSVIDPNIIVISGNTVTITSTTVTTGVVSGIYSLAGGAGIQNTVTGNTVTGCSLTSTTGGFNGIYITHTSTNSVNNISNNTVTSNSLAGTGQFLGVAGFATASAVVNGTLTLSNNTVSSNTKTSTGNMFCVYNGVGTGSSLTMTENNNTVNGNVIGGGSANCTLVGVTAQATNYTMNGNTVTNNSVTAVNGTAVGNVLAIQSSGASTVSSAITNNTVNGVTLGGVSSGACLVRGILATTAGTDSRVISGNDISNVNTSFTTSATCIGIIIATGGNTEIKNNKIHNFTPGQNGVVFSGAKGIIVSGGATTTIHNNLIGFDYTTATPVLVSNNSVVGVEIGAGAATNLYYNTIRLAGSGSGTGFGSSGINITSTTPTVDIRNNIVSNTMNGGGATAAAASVGLRRSSTALTGYASTSNNNLWFTTAIPAAATAVYFDGTTAYASLADFKTQVAGRESNSVTENISSSMISTTGTSSNFLHLTAGASTLAESGAQAIPGFTVDYDGNTRSSSPDIGADEFAGTPIQPYIASVSANPSALIACTSTARTITAEIVGPVNPITGATLNYSFNGTAQTPIAMTNTSGNLWEGTIPAAPGGVSVSYSVTGTDGTYNPAANGTTYRDEPFTGFTASATATPSTVCAGGSSNLKLTLTAPGFSNPSGTATTLSSASSYPTAFGNYWYQSWQQYLFTAAELQAMGLYAGNITSIKFTISALPNPNNTLNDYNIKIGSTSAAALSSFQTTGLLDVFGPAAKTAVGGVNTINFTTPYYWDGVSNIVVDLRFTEFYGNGNATTYYTTTTNNSVLYAYATSSNAAFWTSNPAPTVSTSRPNVILGGIAASTPSTITWSDGSSTVGTTSTLTVTPSASTSYSVIATDANGCSISASTAVTVNPLPETPTATDGSQCGTQTPTCSVSGIAGNTYRWYTVATGGTAIAGQTGSTLVAPYTISATTTYYVSQVDATTGCESPRVMVTQTVITPDAVSASVSANNVCPGSSVNLSASQSGSTQAYTFTWNGSGVVGQVGQTVSITAPATAGTYTYNLSAVDGGCAATASVSLTVINAPVISAVSASSTTICSGGTTTLTALTPQVSSGNSNPSGTGTSLTSSFGYPTAFGNYWYQSWQQYLYTAAELQAMGLYAGNITSLKFNISGLPSPNLALTDYNVKIGSSSASAISTFQTTGLTNVFGPASVTAATGVNTITFSTPYNWDGVSNIVIDLRFTEFYGNANATTFYTTTASNSVVYAYATTSNPSFWSANPTATASTSRPNIILGGQVVNYGAGSLGWSWNNGGGAGNIVSVNPTATTVYTVTATDPTTSCTSTANVTVNVNPLPAAPVATNSSQCGVGVPTCSVSSSESGVGFNWYTAAVGGTLLQSGGSTLSSTSISTTTTFYVSALNVSTNCEGPRTAVLAEVVQPDGISASASSTTICLGSTVDLSVAQTGSSNTYTYTWNGIAGSGITSPLTGGSQTITPTAVGTYTYSVNAVDGGCIASSSVTVNVSGFPSVSTITATPATICNGGSSTLSATSLILASGPQTAPTGYPGYANAFPSTADEQIFSVTFGTMTNNQAETCGSNYTDYSGTVPTPTVTSGNSVAFEVRQNECDGAPYYANGLSIYIDWNRDGDWADAGEQAYTSNGTYAATGASPGGDNVRSGFITVPANASAGVTKMRVIMAEGVSSPAFNENFTYGEQEDYIINVIGATPDASATFAWNPGSLSGSSVSVSPTSTTVYTLAITNAAGCTSTSTVTVNVNPVPSAPTTTASTQCGNGIPSASVTSTSGEATPVYSWYTTATGGTPIQQGPSATLTSTVITTSTTFYVAEVFPATGCESARSSVFAEVNAPDAITANASNATICLGSSINLSVSQTGTTNTYTYTWNGTAGSGITSPLSGGSQNITPTAAGTYTYTLNAVDGSCNTSASVIVTVNSLPNIYSATSSASVTCLGTAVTLAAYAGDNTPAPTTYCTTSNFGGSAITNVTLNTLNRTSGAQTAFPYYESVPEGSATTALVPGNSYTVSLTTDAAAIASVWIDFNHDGVYDATEWVQPIVSGTSGSSVISVPVTAVSGKTGMRVRTRAAGNINGAGDACLGMGSGETEDYTISILSAAGSFVWTDGTSTVSSVNPATITPTANTTYYAVLTGSNGCTATSAGISVAVISTPDVPTITQSVDTVCYSGNVNFNITNAQGGVTYQWQSSSTGLAGSFTDISGAIGATYSVTGLAATTYYQVVASCGSNVSTSAVKSVYRSAPAVTSTVGATRCGPGNVTVSASGSGIFNWYAGSVSTAVLGTGSSYTANLSANTTLWVIASEGTCSETARTPVAVTVNTPPAIVATSSLSAAVCQGTSATLSVTSTNANYTYTWNGNPGGAAGTGSSITVTPSTTTVYTVTATDISGTTFNGCNAVQNVTVSINPLPSTPVITASSAVSCPGTSVTLTATSTASGPQDVPTIYPGYASSFPSTADEQIFGVTFGTMVNNQAENCASNFTDYSTSIAAPTVTAGQTVAFEVRQNECDGATYYAAGVSIFIDFNRDGDWNDAGEQAYSSNGTYAATGASPAGDYVYSGNITIPTSATAGLTKMRVILAEGVSSPTPTEAFSYGEQEDYAVNILGAASSFNWSTGGTGSSISVTPAAGSTTYTVTATSSAGCTSAAGTYTITTTAPPTPVLTATDTTLCAPNSINIFVVDNGTYSSGYPAGTSVEWLGYGATGDPATTPINSSQGSTFQAKVTLPSGCYANSNIVTVTTRDIVVVPTIAPAACGNNNGSISAQIASAPAAPYKYVWTDGTNTLRDTTSSNTSDMISGLAPGTYYLSIYDNQGGSLSCSATNLAYTVGGSTPPVLSATSTNITCNGSGDGTVGVTITSGGTAPFTYSWSNGSTASSQLGVAAGTYTVTVSDVYGCSSSASVTVTEPAAITATSNITQPCVGSSNGSIALTVSGGTGAVSVDWFDGAVNQLTSGNTLTGIGAGTYFALMTDANSCTSIGEYNVTETGQTISTSVNACSSYNWSQNSQTYTASGSYTSVSGCDTYVLNLTVTNVTISSLTPSSGSVGSTVVISGADFTGATGVSFNGTAATSYTVDNNGQITVTVPAGTTTGPVTVSVGGCSATSSGNFTIGTAATLNLKAYMQGYYAGSGLMTSVLANQGVSLNTNEVDTITVELYDGATGATLAASAKGVILTDGTVSLSMPASVVGNSYYIAVKHRNTVVTWSASAITMGATTSYDFTTAATQAYGDNMIEVETGVFAMYTGDVNQDEFVDPYDNAAILQDILDFGTGYYATDLNGDGFVDPYDNAIYLENNINFIMSAHP